MSETNERIERFKYMADADPHNELGHFSLDRAYMDAGRYADAADAFKRAIQHGIELAEYAEELMQADPEWEIVSPAALGIVCFRRRGATDDETDEMVRRAVAGGFTAPSTTILDGRSVARLCTINPRTTNQDIERTLEHLAR